MKPGYVPFEEIPKYKAPHAKDTQSAQPAEVFRAPAKPVEEPKPRVPLSIEEEKQMLAKVAKKKERSRKRREKKQAGEQPLGAHAATETSTSHPSTAQHREAPEVAEVARQIDQLNLGHK